jgi:hypothetical protein
MCKLFYALTSVNWFASVFTLTVLSADRYLAVCHAIDSRRYRTPTIARVVCAAIWAASLVAMFPVYLGARTVVEEEEHRPCQRPTTSGFDEPVEMVVTSQSSASCTLQWSENQLFSAERAFMWYAFALSFALPVSLISVFYSLVVVRLKSVGPHSRALISQPQRARPTVDVVGALNPAEGLQLCETGSRNNICMPTPATESVSGFQYQQPAAAATNAAAARRNHRRRSHRRVTHLVLTVITVYVVCWLPYWVFQVVTSFFDEAPPRWAVATFQYFTALTYANSAVNPVLYAFLSENFRKTFAASFHCDDGNAGGGGGGGAAGQGSAAGAGGVGSALDVVRRLALLGEALTGSGRSSQAPASVAPTTPQLNGARYRRGDGTNCGETSANVEVEGAGGDTTGERRRRPTPHRRRNRGQKAATARRNKDDDFKVIDNAVAADNNSCGGSDGERAAGAGIARKVGADDGVKDRPQVEMRVVVTRTSRCVVETLADDCDGNFDKSPRDGRPVIFCVDGVRPSDDAKVAAVDC